MLLTSEIMSVKFSFTTLTDSKGKNLTDGI